MGREILSEVPSRLGLGGAHRPLQGGSPGPQVALPVQMFSVIMVAPVARDPGGGGYSSGARTPTLHNTMDESGAQKLGLPRELPEGDAASGPPAPPGCLPGP